MQSIMEWAAAAGSQLSRFLWGPPMLFCFLAIGLLFSAGTGWFQITRFRQWMRCTIIACFKDRNVMKSSDGHSISQFQSLCTVLAATTGTGNIVGVAAAITAGGPGALFWMWVSAFLGMMTSYAENVLGSRYRRRAPDGQWEGSAMLYIEKALHSKTIAMVYALFCVLASLGMGNMAQANAIADALSSSLGLSRPVTALAVVLLLTLIIMGGIRRIGQVTEKVVPFMSLLYTGGALLVILAHWQALPAVFASILKEAFQLRAGIGGAAGYGILTAMRTGISRGVFTNEAGMGSSVMVHAASDVKDPVIQGMWGIFEVFADTIVVCTLTGAAILSSGVYQTARYAQALGTDRFDLLANGAELTGQAFATVFGSGGSLFVSVSIVLFAFSTLIGWAYYGEKAAAYLTGGRRNTGYQLLFAITAALGCLAGMELIWELSDTFNVLMAVPNLAALFLLRKEVFSETRRYLRSGRLTD